MPNTLYGLFWWLSGKESPCPSATLRTYLNSCPSSQWCHPTISYSVVPFSSYLQSFPASGSFPMSQFFSSGGQSTGASASTSVLPMNIQDWFPLGWTGWISLQSKGLSRVISNTTVQKYQFFGAQLSSQSVYGPQIKTLCFGIIVFSGGSVDMNLSKFWEIVEDRGVWHAAWTQRVSIRSQRVRHNLAT